MTGPVDFKIQMKKGMIKLFFSSFKTKPLTKD
jgi:hypothetical protein